MSDRVIIGETAQAGLPISALVIKSSQLDPNKHTLRWRETPAKSFVLEHYLWTPADSGNQGFFSWVEVPCVCD